MNLGGSKILAMERFSFWWCLEPSNQREKDDSEWE